MLFSPLSFTSSTPDWLDRLHSSLGDDRSSSLPPPPPPLPCPPPPPAGPTGLTAALADLFHMGGGAPPDRSRRASRKQPNPRSFAPPSGEEARFAAKRRRRPRKAAAAAVSPAPRDAGAKGSAVARKRKAAAVAGGEEGTGRFSRTDVVVIDTSTGEAEWKSAKVIFRKGAAWKVRDKKLWHRARKRRRRLGLAEKRARGAEGCGEAKEDRPGVSAPPEDNHDGKRNSPEDALKDPIVTSEESLQVPRSSRRPTCKEHSISRSHD